MAKLQKGKKIRVYQRPITQEDFEGIFTLVKCVNEDMGWWDNIHYERWIVRDKEGQCARMISERDLN